MAAKELKELEGQIPLAKVDATVNQKISE